MAETVTPKEVMEAAKAERGRRTGEEAWAEKMISRQAEEREAPAPEAKEAEPETVIRSRTLENNVDIGWTQIQPEIAGTAEQVDLDFKRIPEEKEVPLKLVKPGSFGKVYSVEKTPPAGQEETVYLREWKRDETLDWLRSQGEEGIPNDPDTDQFISLLQERKGINPINEYLTDQTINRLELPEAEAQPEAERMPVAA